MKKYRIEILETLSKSITVEADDIGDAIEKVKSQYENEEIVLDASDHVETEFNEIDIGE